MIKISKTQLKIIYLILVLILAFILFLFVIFLPQKSKISRIKLELAATDAQINEIISISQGQDLASAIRKIDQQLNKAVKLLPSKEEVIIKYLSKNARSLEINIKNMSLAEKKEFKDKIEGYLIQELPISMSLSCGYKALGEYLNILRNDDALLIKIKQLSIHGQLRQVLDINMQISVYMTD